MPITVNENGVLYELDTVTSNENGVLYDHDVIHANEGGALYEIFSANETPANILGTITRGYDSGTGSEVARFKLTKTTAVTAEIVSVTPDATYVGGPCLLHVINPTANSGGVVLQQSFVGSTSGELEPGSYLVQVVAWTSTSTQDGVQYGERTVQYKVTFK